MASEERHEYRGIDKVILNRMTKCFGEVAAWHQDSLNRRMRSERLYVKAIPLSVDQGEELVSRMGGAFCGDQLHFGTIAKAGEPFVGQQIWCVDDRWPVGGGSIRGELVNEAMHDGFVVIAFHK